MGEKPIKYRPDRLRGHFVTDILQRYFNYFVSSPGGIKSSNHMECSSTLQEQFIYQL